LGEGRVIGNPKICDSQPPDILLKIDTSIITVCYHNSKIESVKFSSHCDTNHYSYSIPDKQARPATQFRQNDIPIENGCPGMEQPFGGGKDN
jgi:hypothetical protein